MISEWDPILTPAMREYALVRLNDKLLEIKLDSCKDITIRLDAKVIPQLRKILERLDTEI